MNKHITIILILFFCFGCTNTNIESDSIDEENVLIEEVYEVPPYSTLGEYKHLDYHCPEFLTFDSTLFYDYNRLAIMVNNDKSSKGNLFYIGIYETEGTLYAGEYEVVENDLFGDNLYSFNGDFTSVMDYYYDEFTFPLENNDIDGYFVLSKDFKTLYFLTEEKQLSSSDYQNAQTCTILYYE